MTLTSVVIPSWTRLSRGMLIKAGIEARLLGKKLLTLDAEITVVPAETRTQIRRSYGVPQVAGRDFHPTDMEHPSSTDGGLAEAARLLEASAADLRAAREGMP